MEDNKIPTPEVEGQEWVEIDKDTLYCLAQHFSSLFTQCGEDRLADFAEPCETCKLGGKCLGNWQRVLPFMEKGQFRMVLSGKPKTQNFISEKDESQ